MKVQAQKSSKCLAEITLKTNDLIKEYKPSYQNQIKKQYSDEAFYYHRYQKGLIKISRWTFDVNRKKDIEIEKLPLQVNSTNCEYQYDQNDDVIKRIFWVNFSDRILFNYDETDYFGQSEKQSLAHPILSLITKYIEEKQISDLGICTEEGEIPTPFIFENVPQWINVTSEKLQQGFEIYQKDKKNNIIAMKALSSEKGEYTENQIKYLLMTVLCAFSAACKQSYISKRNTVIIHTGNWGCGNYGNSNELIYLVQMIGASATGVSEIYFHKVDEQAFNSAKEKFNSMPEKLTLKKLVAWLMSFNFHWQQDDVKDLLTKMGLHYGMTEHEILIWKKNQQLIKQIKNTSLYDFFNTGINITEDSLGYCKTIGDIVNPGRDKNMELLKQGKELNLIYKKLESIGIKCTMTDEEWQNWAWKNQGKTYLYFMDKIY